MKAQTEREAVIASLIAYGHSPTMALEIAILIERGDEFSISRLRRVHMELRERNPN